MENEATESDNERCVRKLNEKAERAAQFDRVKIRLWRIVAAMNNTPKLPEHEALRLKKPGAFVKK